jgi:predicted MPP superfamily phosphohydrolase
VLSVAGVAAVAGDGFLRSNEPQIRRVQIPLARLPESFDGFTIAQISDFHYDDRFSVVPIRQAVEVISELHPDLIALTGDFVSVPLLSYHNSSARRFARDAEPCAELLQDLHAPEGTFAILGNHDAGSDSARIVGALKSHGIPTLVNRAIPVEKNGSRMWIVGLDDVLEGRPDIDRVLAGVPPNEVVVLLAHEPDFADHAAARPVDLQLSGHSHGGQVWIPGIGAPWLPPLAVKYPRGLYRMGKLTLYTNIGIGTIRAPIRLNCPPEITLITLRAGKRADQAIRNDPNRL